MGWGCYRHEMDAGSDGWKSALEDVIGDGRKRCFGRDGEVCPRCYLELEAALRDALACLAEAREAVIYRRALGIGHFLRSKRAEAFPVFEIQSTIPVRPAVKP